MKKTGDLQDQLHFLTLQIEQKLLELEKNHTQQSQGYNDLFAEVGRLAELSAQGPAYVHERSLRLCSLVSKINTEHASTGRVYGALFRQISKIQDNTISDYFSPAVNRNLDRILRQRTRFRTGTHLVIYQLGDMLFGVYGQLSKRFRGIKGNRTQKIKVANKQIEFFPHNLQIFTNADHESKSYDLLIFRSKSGKHYGFWTEGILDMQKEAPAKIQTTLHPSAKLHRLVSGSFQKSGKRVNLIQLT